MIKSEPNYKLRKNLPADRNIDSWLQILSQKNNCNLASQSFQNIHFEKVCQALQEWGLAREFRAYGCKKMDILLEIKNISFPFLKSLNIWGNHIESIEAINSLSMPQLQQLWIWQNHIVSIKPLRRANFPQLTILDIKSNFIADHTSLSQFYSPKQQIKRLDMGNSNSMIVCDPRIVIKMQSRVGQLYFYGNNIAACSYLAEELKLKMKFQNQWE